MNKSRLNRLSVVNLNRVITDKPQELRKMINGVEHWWDPIKEIWREALYSPRSKKD